MRTPNLILCAALLLIAGCTATPILSPQSATPSGSDPTLIVTEPQGNGPDDLAAISVPVRDRFDLARRFRGVSQPDSVPSTASLRVGDSTTFWVQNTSDDTSTQITAHLVAAGEHIAMWVQDGVSLDVAGLQTSANRFDHQTYEMDRSIFGSEALPGIDGDPRVHVLHTTELGGGVAGYFYSPSEYPANVVPYSNEKELVYISADGLKPGSDRYDAVLAHEFQHMIHWNIDRNEESWMNEGLSVVAATVNGFGLSEYVPSFVANPNLQLTAWPEEGSQAPHYGAAYLFNMYFLDRFGASALKKLVAHPENGLVAVDATLAEIRAGVTADEVFRDWLVANLLNDPGASSGIYAYHNLPELTPVAVTETLDQPVEAQPFQAHQYGAQYISISSISVPGKVRITVQGEAHSSILPTTTGRDDGAMVWWSNRADNSDTMLTRELDLSGVSQAELTFDLWYALEDGWDYGLVSASTDGGTAWTILKGRYTSDFDPHGNAYGLSYTGQSVTQPDANADGWLAEKIDLNAYAGKKILLRFEMITDDAVNQPGVALDNICVQAIEWCDNAEQGTNGWTAAGFARIDNVLPQTYTAIAVWPRSDGTVEVIPIQLDADNTGELEGTINPAKPLVLIVSGLTRFTTELAPFTVTVQPVSP